MKKTDQKLVIVLISRLQGHLWYLFIQPALAGKNLNFPAITNDLIFRNDDPLFQAVAMLKEKAELITRLRATMKETAHPEWPGNITNQWDRRFMEDDSWLYH